MHFLGILYASSVLSNLNLILDRIPIEHHVIVQLSPKSCRPGIPNLQSVPVCGSGYNFSPYNKKIIIILKLQTICSTDAIAFHIHKMSSS